MNQMTSGMNAIIYFSNILFQGRESPTSITMMVGLFNFASTIVGVYMISKFTRRKLMIVSNFLMTLF